MRRSYLGGVLVGFGLVGAGGQSVCLAQTAAPSEEKPSPLQVIEKTLEARRQELHIPGVAFAIVKDDQVIYSHGFGVRDVEHNLPVTADTLFAIGSSTKAFTAMTMLMSADDGKLRLADSPKKYLPYFHMQDPDADQRITLTDLLCHRSGLARTDMLWITGALNAEQLIRALGDVKPTAKLGEKFQYQNLMFLTAGEIVSKVQGAPWPKVLERRIFRPLGMSETNTTVAAMEKTKDHALGYTWQADKQAYKYLPMREVAAVAPAGAINSNVKDMAKWVQFMLDGGVWNGKRLISKQNFAEMTVPRITVAGETKYGYGWFLRNWNGHKVVEHGGNIDGFNAEVALMPDQHLGFVMLTNISASSLGETAQTTVWENIVGKPTAKAGAGKPTPPVPQLDTTTVAADGGPYKELLGPYKALNVPLTLEVAVRNGKVALVVPGQPAYPLVEKAKDTYALGPLPPDFGLLIHRDAAGKVISATLKQPAAQGSIELAFGNAPVSADLPAIDEVMEKHIAAQGGEAALRRHHSQVLEIHFESPTQGISGTTVIRAKAPCSEANETTITAQKKRIYISHEYFDGQTAAASSTLAPLTIKSEKQAAEAKVSSDFYAPLNWKTLYPAAKVTGRMKLGEEECYVVEFKSATGGQTLKYISAQTYLLLKEQTFSVIPGVGPVPTSETFSDYRTVDGVKIPFKRVSISPAEGESVSTVTRVRFNVNLPDSTFRAPKQPGS